jgi:polyhydroxyalkanoate synthesis regulator phasin
VNREQSVLTFLVIIIILGALFFIGSMIPLQALSKEGQLLNNDNVPQGFGPYVNGGDEGINSLLLESVPTTDIYDYTTKGFQDCIYRTELIESSTVYPERIQCNGDESSFKIQYSPNGNVPIIKISTATQENSSGTTNTDTVTSNASTAGINEQNKLINELVNTGKLTEEEAKKIIARVMLINELVQSGKFTEEEAKEFVTNVMNNGTDEANVTDGVNVPEVPEVPEANVTTTVPELLEVPEANVTTTVPELPEANVTTTVPELLEVPEANVTTTVPELLEVPEANVTTTVPLENNTGLVNLELSVKQDPISSGGEQTVTLIASDPITGAPLDRIFVHLTIKDPAGNIVKDYTDNDGQLSPTFLINEGEVGTFTVLGTALQAGVESTKSLTFQVQ